MTNELKRVGKGVFCSLLLVIHWTGAYSVEDVEPLLETETNDFGEICGDRICKENQYCSLRFMCECRPGFRLLNNECIPRAGENETCTRHEDCYANLLCINGICKRRGSNNEFVALAKICLGITVTSIIIALFSSSIKFLLRSDSSRSFQRQSVSSRLNPIFRGDISSPRNLYEIHDEKPPSYEECMRSMPGNPLPSPPPYVISTNPVTPTSQTTPIQTINSQASTPLNSTTPLSVQNLNIDINSNLAAQKDSEIDNKNSAKNS